MRDEQIIYAALDAYCLIEIYEMIKNQCERNGIDFNELVHSFLVENKNKLSFKKSANALGNIPANHKSANAPRYRPNDQRQMNHPKNEITNSPHSLSQTKKK